MNSLPEPRWQTYVLSRAATLEPFWHEHLSSRERALLFVLPESFDPRSTLALQHLLAVQVQARIDVLAIEYDEGVGGAYLDLTAQNRSKVEESCSGRAELTRTRLAFYADGRRVVASRAGELFNTRSQIEPHSDIVVDVSGMPRTVFFPLIARLLYLIDSYPQGTSKPNLLVIVAEDTALDAAIAQHSVEEFADYLPMFRGGFDQEATADRPRVLLPLLGENRGVQLERILDLVKPDETCPVLPSPARNPRRGDNLMLEYRAMLFDQLLLDPRAFLYAAEQNPFEVYRSLRHAVGRYLNALTPLGGCKVAFAALSSKLMSVGALLAAYELKRLQVEVGIAHVDCQTYHFEKRAAAPEFFALWLTGECYDG